MSIHKKLRQNDEYFCTRCCCRWDVDEDEPVVCISAASSLATKKPVKRQRAYSASYVHKLMNKKASSLHTNK